MYFSGNNLTTSLPVTGVKLRKIDLADNFRTNLFINMNIYSLERNNIIISRSKAIFNSYNKKINVNIVSSGYKVK